MKASKGLIVFSLPVVSAITFLIYRLWLFILLAYRFGTFEAEKVRSMYITEISHTDRLLYNAFTLHFVVSTIFVIYAAAFILSNATQKRKLT